MINKILKLVFGFISRDVQAADRPIEISESDEKASPFVGAKNEPGTLAWYAKHWDKARLRSGGVYDQRLEWHCTKLIKSMDRYKAIEGKTGVPWYVVGAIHGLEASFNFTTYLHNGDPLGRKTVNVPKGVGPFSDWETAAVDALTRKNLQAVGDWSIEVILQRCEKYNGLGYLKFHPAVLSPYVWSGTTNYTNGKYISDGKWSGTSVSKQVGVATTILQLQKLGYIKIKRYTDVG
jgi:lysozyme family protein